MASKTLLNTLLFYQCFDDVWTTIWWIVQIQCAVFQNKKSFNKERIPTKLSTLHSNFCEVESDYFESHCIVDLEKILVCCHDHAHPPHPLAVAMVAPPVSWTCTSRLWRLVQKPGNEWSIPSNAFLHRKWRCGWEKVREERSIQM